MTNTNLTEMATIIFWRLRVPELGCPKIVFGNISFSGGPCLLSALPRRLPWPRYKPYKFRGYLKVTGVSPRQCSRDVSETNISSVCHML